MRERHESQIKQAERLVVEELKKRKLKESDLPALKKGDSRKIGIAQRLREETMVTVKWISERLHMGSVAYVNNRLYLKRKGRLGKFTISSTQPLVSAATEYSLPPAVFLHLRRRHFNLKKAV